MMRLQLPVWLVLLSIMTGGLVQPAKAEHTDSPGHDYPEEPTDEVTPRTWGPYCGLYAVYAALRLQDVPVDFSSLLKPEYCSDSAGSSLDDLRRAVEDAGLHALPVRGMTTADLKAASSPVVLHVRREVAGREHEHYVLFLNAAGNRAIILDPPNPVRAMEWHDLAGQWSGTGLIVSREPQTAAGMSLRGVTEVVTLLGAVGVFLAAFAIWPPAGGCVYGAGQAGGGNRTGRDVRCGRIPRHR